MWRGDAQDLVKLISADIIDGPGDWSRHLNATLQDLVDSHGAACCGMVGDELIRRSDQAASTAGANVRKTNSWRLRVANWLHKE